MTRQRRGAEVYGELSHLDRWGDPVADWGAALCRPWAAREEPLSHPFRRAGANTT
jgi:hypothetical protein